MLSVEQYYARAYFMLLLMLVTGHGWGFDRLHPGRSGSWTLYRTLAYALFSLLLFLFLFLVLHRER